MKKTALIKDTLREIRGSLGRFISIMMIVAIGVAFFAGVKASVPDMKYTADSYFDDYNLMDIRVLSTLGLTDEDVEAIRNIEGVEGVMPSHSMDVLTNIDTQQLIFKVHALDLNIMQEDNVNYMNRPVLKEGRLPEKSGECVIELGQIITNSVHIGDVITLQSGSDTAIEDSLNVNEYTVVGTVHSPYYLSFDKGSSSIGSGKIDYYIMIPESDFASDIYTEINVRVAGAKELNSYDDAYFDVMDKVKTEIEGIANERADIRLEEVKGEAQVKIDEGLQEYGDGRATFEKEIANAQATLNKAYQDIQDGTTSLVNEKATFAKTYADSKATLANGKQQIADAKVAYQAGVQAYQKQYNEAQSQIVVLQSNEATAKSELKKIDTGIAQVQAQLETPEISEAEKVQLQEQLIKLTDAKIRAEGSLAYVQTALTTIQTKLQEGQATLDQTQLTITSQEQALQAGEAQLLAGEALANQKFMEAEAKLIAGQNEYEVGSISLQNQKINTEADLALAKEKLDKAQRDLDDIQKPEWFVLDRHSHYSYMDYGSVADRMDGIAKVFPVFFFLVAALVCLTTMTRMVEEQRGTIGTLKALGYSKAAIAFKYVAYALIAGIFGSLIGCGVGMYVFPLVIFNAWNIMYTLPAISFEMQPVLAIGSSCIVIGITVLAAYAAVYKELIETPALLMRPKAPRLGKKILLERWHGLWKHLSFTQKVTARNIFRYKKRFFMTILGISGCTALLVAGYGIQDSISQVVTKQFGEVLKYDVLISFEKDTALQTKNEIIANIQLDPNYSDAMGIAQINGNVDVNGKDEAVSIVSPSDKERFKAFVSLHKRGSTTELELQDDGALISEKLANNAGVGIGDTLLIENGDGVKREIIIGGIVENYINHYVYMSAEYYKTIFQVHEVDTTIIAKLPSQDAILEASLGNTLMENDSIASVSFFSGIAKSFQDTISSLIVVVIVLIIAAGMLAFVVLYNLTNVNVSERLREIATIKVLGFYDKEVAEYVYRENILLTIIGSLCGLGLGIGLHRIIMNLAEMENIMFGRNINTLSFVLAFLITMGFSLLVNVVMYRKLVKIPMVESLKSVE